MQTLITHTDKGATEEATERKKNLRVDVGHFWADIITGRLH